MKQMVLILSVLAMTSLAMTVNGASPAKGKELFTSKQLGTSGKSCSSCHPDGKGLAKAAEYDEVELGAIINQCIAERKGDRSGFSRDEIARTVHQVAGPLRATPGQWRWSLITNPAPSQ